MNTKNTNKTYAEELIKKNKDFILGVKVNFVKDIEEAVNIIELLLEDNKNHIVCTTNAEFIIDAQKDPEFKRIINNSSLSIPDGIGVLYAKKYKEAVNKKTNALQKLFILIKLFVDLIMNTSNFGAKVSGVDLTTEILKKSVKKQYTAFFLGGMATDYFGNKIYPQPYDISKKARDKMVKKYPNLNIIGATSQFSREEVDDVKTISYIRNCMKKNNISTLDFLFVGYNHNHQEKWIMRNSSKIPVKVSIGVGGTFDYLSGYLKRPTSYKYEWLKKLLYRPFKFKRIFKAIFILPYLLYIDSISKK